MHDTPVPTLTGPANAYAGYTPTANRAHSDGPGYPHLHHSKGTCLCRAACCFGPSGCICRICSGDGHVNCPAARANAKADERIDRLVKELFS